MQGLRAIRRDRRGMSLLEVIVVVAIAIMLAGVIIPSISEIMALQQRQVAKNLAIRYSVLHEEAVMRNVTFRIAYHLDANYFEVEVGDANTLIFADPDKREEYEKEQAAKLRRYTKREKAAGEADHLEEQPFMTMNTQFMKKIQLPRNARFGGVYTPQHEDMVFPSGDEEDPDEPLVVYSYIFANGYSERAIIQIVDANDDDSGFTVEVEPLSGRVTLHTELLDNRDLEMDIPDSGPELTL